MDGKSPRQVRPASHPIHHQTDDDYKAAADGIDDSVDYKQFMPKLKPEHKVLKRFIKVLVTLAVIAGLGYGAYYFGSHYKSKPAQSTKKTTTTTTSQVTPPAQTYTSSNQNLTFSYPSGWKVTETATVLTATSPAMKLTAYNRQTVTGQILFRIRAQGTALPEFSTGSATAILPSQIITYASPTSSQRGTAYISFLNYANAPGSGIDGIYITGNTGYQAGQYSTQAQIQAVDPIISFTFEKCTTSSCSTTTPLTISAGSWSNKSFSNPLLTMLESLSLS